MIVPGCHLGKEFPLLRGCGKKGPDVGKRFALGLEPVIKRNTAAPLAGYLAMPTLAALLMMTISNMSKPQKWRGYWAAPNEDRLLLMLTLLLTVLADLTVANGVGVGIGLAIRLRDSKSRDGEWRPPRSLAMPTPRECPQWVESGHSAFPLPRL